MDVLLRSCWAIVQLVNPIIVDNWDALASSLELCKCLASLFVALGDSGHELQSRVLPRMYFIRRH